MEILSSCKDSIANCIEQKFFAIAHLYSDEKPMDMHIHDCYEIYYSISGGKQFLIDNCFYNIFPGDIFFINQYESHHLTQIDSQVHERIIISIYPDFFKVFVHRKHQFGRMLSKQKYALQSQSLSDHRGTEKLSVFYS